MNHKKQSGFLALLTVVIITVFSVLSASIAYLFISRTTSTTYMLSRNRAFTAASSGIEQGLLVLNDKTLTDRSSCNALTQTLSFSNENAAVSSISLNSFISTASPIAGEITASDLTIEVDDSSNYSQSGRIYIDKEAIDYLTNNTTTNTLSGLYRAQAGTMASSHSEGSVASQFQCYFESIGTSTTSGITGRSTLRIANQSETVMSVGANQTLLQWNTPASELSWASMSGNSNSVQFNAIDLLNAHEGWAVGNATSGGRFSINHLEQGVWTSLTINISGLRGQKLLGVSSVSSQEAWAVGELDGSNTVLLKWNGNTWLNTTINGTASNLNDISVMDTQGDGLGNFGFAVGGSSTSSSSCSSQFYQCYGDNTTACQAYLNNTSCYTETNPSEKKCSKTRSNKDYSKCIDNGDHDKCEKFIENCTEGNGADDSNLCLSNFYVCLSNNALAECQAYVSDSACYTQLSSSGNCDKTRSNKNYLKCIDKDKGSKCIDYIEDCTENLTIAANSQEGAILKYNGSTWINSPINNQSNLLTLNSVSIIPNGTSLPLDAYAVGESTTNNGVLLKWNSTDDEWNILPSPQPTQIMRSISMIDTTGNAEADYGLAVGDLGNIYEYNAGTWTALSRFTNSDLFSVKVLSRSNAWVVGGNGTRYHWDGSSWIETQSGVSTTETLYGIGVAYALSNPSSGWQETLN